MFNLPGWITSAGVKQYTAPSEQNHPPGGIKVFSDIISSMENPKFIGVFCSSTDLPEKYITPSKEFAKLMVERGYNLVWGGSDTGLMKVIASGVQEAGGKIHGVSMELLRDRARQNADDMYFAKDLAERKALMLEKSAALAILPGGIGTIDEATEMLERRKHKLHTKQMVFLNIDGFYDGLATQMRRMDQEGFLPEPLEEMVHFALTPLEALEYIDQRLG